MATQEQSQHKSGSGTSVNDTYLSTPTSGNVLITAISIDKNSGTITIPSGWTVIGATYVSGSVSGAWAYKISDGTEGTVTWNWATTQFDVVMWLAEYSGIDTLDVQASADSGASSVTSQSSGTTGTTDIATAHAFAIFGVDTFDNVDGGRTYSNSFTEIDARALDSPGLMIAEKVLSATGTQECTYATTDGGDQMFGKISVFNLAAGGGGSTFQAAWAMNSNVVIQ